MQQKQAGSRYCRKPKLQRNKSYMHMHHSIYQAMYVLAGKGCMCVQVCEAEYLCIMLVPTFDLALARTAARKR